MRGVEGLEVHILVEVELVTTRGGAGGKDLGILSEIQRETTGLLAMFLN